MSETARKAPTGPEANRWQALVFIALAQLVVVLDATIVNIALPSAQRDLGISDGNRQWVITAYALAFGGLLLFGGRVSDLWGRKRAFIVGLIGFGAASALGGAATNQVMLFSARALQGVFGAVLAPAALSLLSVLFTDPKERARAFGVFSVVSGAGGVVGLVLGGVLTQYLDWRWNFFVNIPVVAIVVVGAWFVIREPQTGRNRSPLDIPGVILSATGLFALVYGFTRAESDGWADPLTLGVFAASVVLLVAFVLTQARVKAPLLPLRVVTERNRGGAFLSLGLANIAVYGVFLFFTYYLQVIKGFSPVQTGFAFLPMIVGVVIGSTQISVRLVNRVPTRLLMGPGFLTVAIGMFLLTRMQVDSSYVGLLLPAQLIVGLGLGAVFMPANTVATREVEPRDAGVASAMVNTSQQLGGAIGTALLNTVAASAMTSYVRDHVTPATTTTQRQLIQLHGMVHGYANAAWVGVGIVLAAGVTVVTLVKADPRHTPTDPLTDAGPEPQVPLITH
ncbi:MFS transporter [Streptomyces sp. NPDC050508]|uniref:MFS transporter n=1 Tax=Streptomyces sp. NPDC050508 TaxID=3155405 RepID=UPI003443B128